MTHAPSTETLTIQAGDNLTFAHTSIELNGWNNPLWFENCKDGRGTCWGDQYQAGTVPVLRERRLIRDQ